MLTIRLSRIGKKNKPMYRLIISEKARDPYGKALEILGSYNPYSKELQINEEKTKTWISKGAGMSPTVNNLLIEKGIIKGEKIKSSKISAKKKKAIEEKTAKAEEPKEEEKKESPVEPTEEPKKEEEEEKAPVEPAEEPKEEEQAQEEEK